MTLLQTPGPAAFPKVAVDAYKTRAPAYTMAARPKPAEGKAVKPGPADYNIGRVRQLAALLVPSVSQAQPSRLSLLP